MAHLPLGYRLLGSFFCRWGFWEVPKWGHWKEGLLEIVTFDPPRTVQGLQRLQPLAQGLLPSVVPGRGEVVSIEV